MYREGKIYTQEEIQVFDHDWKSLAKGVYKTGRQVTEDFKQTMEILFDEYLPQWNYTAQPQGA